MSQRFLSIASYTFNQNLWLNKGADVAGGSGGETELSVTQILNWLSFMTWKQRLCYVCICLLYTSDAADE